MLFGGRIIPHACDISTKAGDSEGVSGGVGSGGCVDRSTPIKTRTDSTTSTARYKRLRDISKISPRNVFLCKLSV